MPMALFKCVKVYNHISFLQPKNLTLLWQWSNGWMSSAPWTCAIARLRLMKYISILTHDSARSRRIQKTFFFWWKATVMFWILPSKSGNATFTRGIFSDTLISTPIFSSYRSIVIALIVTVNIKLIFIYRCWVHQAGTRKGTVTPIKTYYISLCV